MTKFFIKGRSRQNVCNQKLQIMARLKVNSNWEGVLGENKAYILVFDQNTCLIKSFAFLDEVTKLLLKDEVEQNVCKQKLQFMARLKVKFKENVCWVMALILGISR